MQPNLYIINYVVHHFLVYHAFRAFLARKWLSAFASFRSSGARTITQRCLPNFAENFRAAFTPACVSYASMACGGLPQVSGRLVGAAAAGTDGSL